MENHRSLAEYLGTANEYRANEHKNWDEFLREKKGHLQMENTKMSHIKILRKEIESQEEQSLNSQRDHPQHSQNSINQNGQVLKESGQKSELQILSYEEQIKAQLKFAFCQLPPQQMFPPKILTLIPKLPDFSGSPIKMDFMTVFGPDSYIAIYHNFYCISYLGRWIFESRQFQENSKILKINFDKQNDQKCLIMLQEIKEKRKISQGRLSRFSDENKISSRFNISCLSFSAKYNDINYLEASNSLKFQQKNHQFSLSHSEVLNYEIFGISYIKIGGQNYFIIAFSKICPNQSVEDVQVVLIIPQEKGAPQIKSYQLQLMRSSKLELKKHGNTLYLSNGLQVYSLFINKDKQYYLHFKSMNLFERVNEFKLYMTAKETQNLKKTKRRSSVQENQHSPSKQENHLIQGQETKFIRKNIKVKKQLSLNSQEENLEMKRLNFRPPSKFKTYSHQQPNCASIRTCPYETTKEIMDYHILAGNVYVVTKDLELFKIEESTVLFIQSIHILIAQSKKIEPGRIHFGRSGQEETIVELYFQTSSSKQSVFMIVRTSYEDRMSEQGWLENTVYLFCIKEREIRFERKLTYLLDTIRGFELNLSKEDVKSLDLRLIWYDDCNFDLYYEKTQGKENRHSGEKSEIFKIFRTSFLNCWTIGFEKPDYNKNPIISYFTQKSETNQSKSMFFISNDFNLRGVIFKEYPYRVQIHYYMSQHFQFISEKLIQKPICVAVNHLPEIKSILISFGNFIKQYSMVELMSSGYRLHQSKTLQIEGIMSLEFSKDMHWLLALSTEKMYFIDPWAFETMKILNLDSIFRYELELSLNKHHLVLSNLRPKNCIKKKSLSLSSQKKAIFHLYTLQTCLSSNQPAEFQIDLDQFEADIKQYLSYTSSENLFIVSIKTLLLFFRIGKNQGKQPEYSLQLNCLQPQQIITSICLYHDLLFVGTNLGKIRIIYVKIDSEGMAIPFLAKYLQNTIKKVRMFRNHGLLILYEHSITYEAIKSVHIGSTRGLKLVCQTASDDIIEFQLKISEQIMSTQFKNALNMVEFASVVHPQEQIKFKLLFEEFRNHTKQEINSYKIKIHELREEQDSYMSEYRIKTEEEANKIKEMIIQEMAEYNIHRRQIENSYNRDVKKLCEESSSYFSTLKGTIDALEQNSKNLFRELEQKKNTGMKMTEEESRIIEDRVKYEQMLEQHHRKQEQLEEKKQQLRNEHHEYAEIKNEELEQLTKKCKLLENEIKINKQIDIFCFQEEESILSEFKCNIIEGINKELQQQKEKHSQLSMHNVVIQKQVESLREKSGVMEKNRTLLERQLDQLRDKKKEKSNVIALLKKLSLESQEKIKNVVNSKEYISNIKHNIIQIKEKQFVEFASIEVDKQLKNLGKKFDEIELQEQKISENLQLQYNILQKQQNKQIQMKIRYDSLKRKCHSLSQHQVQINKKKKAFISNQIQNINSQLKIARRSPQNKYQMSQPKKYPSSYLRIRSKMEAKIEKIKDITEKWTSVKSKTFEINKAQRVDKEKIVLVYQLNELFFQNKQLRERQQILRRQLDSLKESIRPKGLSIKLVSQNRAEKQSRVQKKISLPSLCESQCTSFVEWGKLTENITDMVKKKNEKKVRETRERSWTNLKKQSSLNKSRIKKAISLNKNMSRQIKSSSANKQNSKFSENLQKSTKCLQIKANKLQPPKIKLKL